MNTEPDLLTTTSLSKAYGDTTVVDDVDFSVARGEVKAIIGPSGSGKSTLLRLLALLEPVDEGKILLDNRHIGSSFSTKARRRTRERVLVEERRDIGMVFQRFNLFPHLSAVRNVMLGLTEVMKMSRTEAEEVATTYLAQVGIADRRHAYPSELSGGQQQRVAIARALVMKPKIMLFDEPTSALDPELINEVLKVITDLASKGMTMAVVTHEIGFAREVADQVLMFDQGRIVQEAPPDEFFGPDAHERTRRFLNHLR